MIRNPLLGNSISNLSGADFFNRLSSSLISLAFVIGVLIFVFMFISGAIMWISSGGEKGQIEVARKRVTSSGIGLALLLLIFTIIILIGFIFDVDLLNLDINGLTINNI